MVLILGGVPKILTCHAINSFCMRVSIQIWFVFAFLFLTSILEAQYSGGAGGSGSSGTGSGGSGGSSSNAGAQAWPSNPTVRYPVDFPPRVNGVSPPAGVTWSGTLEETFVAVYIAPNGDKIEYRWLEKSEQIATSSVETTSTALDFERQQVRREFRNHPQKSYRCSNINGFKAKRLTKTKSWRTGNKKIIEDAVEDRTDKYTNLTILGDQVAVLATSEKSASIVTTMGADFSRSINSHVSKEPCEEFPEVPDVDESFSIDLSVAFGSSWALSRYFKCVVPDTPAVDIRERGIFPSSGGTGSLSFGAFDTTRSISNNPQFGGGFIIGLSVLDPSEQYRNIYFYVNIGDYVIWNPPPFF
jgi:hypothetical protein